MKSSSITGLSYAFVPADTTNQSTYAVTSPLMGDFTVAANNFYLFEGEMPDPAVLQTYNDSAKLLNDYSAKLITKILNFDIKYTYDQESRTRKLQKFPVDAKTMTSNVDGTAGWCTIELAPNAISSPFKCLIFTDAIGGWDDANQSILVSSTSVVKGESVTIKDVNITLRDAMLVDLTPAL